MGVKRPYFRAMTRSDDPHFRAKTRERYILNLKDTDDVRHKVPSQAPRLLLCCSSPEPSTMTSDHDIQARIQEAVQSAKYNEAVIISTEDNGNTREIVLVACLDRDHGGIVWRDASFTESNPAINSSENVDGSNKDDIGIKRHLRTKLWAVPMLNDNVRNEMYDRTVRDACQKAVRKRMQDPDHDGIIRILDIGSGTGLIAIMAAKHCRDAIHEAQKLLHPKIGRQMSVQVTSCEMASAMARLARMTVHENKNILTGQDRIDCSIVVVECHSTDGDFAIRDSRFEEQPFGEEVQQQQQKADICTSELLDSGLLGEGVLPSLRDAWNRHLKPDAEVLPLSARVVAVLVEGSTIPNKQTANDPDSSLDRNLNGATVFYGPELKSFQRASGGVWLATAPEKDGVLLGTKSEISQSTTAGGIHIPLHANAVFEHQDKLHSSLIDPLQGYDGYSINPDAVSKGTNDKANKHNSMPFIGVRALTDPTIVLAFDFSSGLNSFPPQEGRLVTTSIVPNADGIVHGVLFWWELDLGVDNSNTYSTEPTGCFDMKKSSKDATHCKMQWQDHWQQCLYLFGDDGASRKVKKGSALLVNASHDDYSICFHISDYSDVDVTRPTTRRKLDGESGKESLRQEQIAFNRHISTCRALQLNDPNRTSLLRDAVMCALEKKGKNAPLLDLSDMGLCGLIAAVAGKATCVTSFESGNATLAATIAQLGNALSPDNFQVIQALSENVTIDYIAGGKAAEIVVGEPYYGTLEGWHIHEALNYFYHIRSFKSRGLISEHAISVPSLACVMACVIEFEDFRNAYGSIGGDDEKVAEIQHKTVNNYGNLYDTYDVSLPLWQYRYKRLSKAFCVTKIVYEGESTAIQDDKWVTTTFETTGRADAVVFWVDYLCRSTTGIYHTKGTASDERFNVISTSSPTHRQNIRKLSSSMLISETDLDGSKKFLCRSKFDINDHGGTEDDHYFSYKFVSGENNT